MVPGIPALTGVDMHLPDPDSGVPQHSEYRRLDVRSIGDHFDRGSFEGVVALDLIEHLSRSEGVKLLDALETIASKRVVVFTPNGFLAQPPAPDNPYQEHVSGWTVDDFESRDYRVFGVNGWRPLRGPYAAIRWRPNGFFWRLSLLTQPIVESRPRSAFQLLCIKDQAR
jgi:hypothetical protein